MTFAREGSRTNGADLISTAIGSNRYLQPWYPDELTKLILGDQVKAKEPIALSRYYSEAKVVVDFEPDPKDSRFYIDEKRRWCTEQGLAYVPVYLADQLTLDQFTERLREAQAALTADRRAEGDRKVLDAAQTETTALLDPAVVLYVDRESLRRLEAGLAEGHNWRGASRTNKLATFKRQVIAEIVEKYPRGTVGPEFRAHDAPAAAG